MTDADLIDYTSVDGDRSTARMQTWDVPWESGKGTDERTGVMVELVWTGAEWTEVKR